MPKLIWAFLSLLILAGSSARATTIYAAAPQNPVSVGDTFAVTVGISGVKDLYAFQFDLDFDPTLLAARSVTEDGYFRMNGVAFSPGFIDNALGVVSFVGDSLSGPGPGLTGSSELATVYFTALNQGVTKADLGNVILLDSGLNSLGFASQNADINIGRVATTPEPPSIDLLAMGAGFFGLLAVARHRFLPDHSCRWLC